MAYSQPLPDNTQMKLKQTNYPHPCGTPGCNAEVRFRFDGSHPCRHDVCGSCLSNMYITQGQPIYCPQCIQQNEKHNSNVKHVSYITYESLIKTFADAAICTTCFTSKVIIYQGRCGHLVCWGCVQDFSRGYNFVTCSVKNCSAILKGEDLADVLMWRTFKIPKIQSCFGHRGFCEEKAVVALKQCNHGYCVACLRNMSIVASGGDTVNCNKIHCNGIIPKQIMDIFLTKLDDIHFMTTVCLSLSPVQCLKCKQSDRKDSTKIRLRNRLCYYDHAFCLECFSVAIPSCNQNAGRQTGAMDQKWICPVKKCNIETPFRCVVEMRNAVTNSNGVTGLFIRKAYWKEMCSKCIFEEGIITMIACHHSLCGGCLRRTVSANTSWFHECEGDYMKCKFMVPAWVLQETLKTYMLAKPANKFDDKGDEFDAFRLPNIVLEKSLYPDRCCLHLKAQINSCLPLQNCTWKKNGKVMQVEGNAKYLVTNTDLKDSVLVVSSLEETDEGTYTFLAENRSGRRESNAVSFKIPHDPPRVNLTLKKSHGSSQITAKINSKWPVTETRWLQNGGTVHSMEKMTNLERKEQYIFSQTIELNTFQEEVKGYYQCVAVSVAGEGTSVEIHVNITEKPPDVHLVMEINKRKRKVTLRGEIKSTSSLKPVTWMKNGEVLNISDTQKFDSWYVVQDKATLFISKVDKSDEGDYQLVAQNAGGEGKSNPAILQIVNECDTPKIKLREPYEDPYSITLTAEIDSDWPVTSLTWCKDEQILQMSDIYKEYNGQSIGRLRIYNSKEAGKFELVAENIAGVSKSDVITLCYEEPSYVHLVMEINKRKRKVTLRGEIKSTSSLKPVTWMKNGEVLNISDIQKFSSWHVVQHKATLYIFNVDKSDEGEYQFVAQNAGGEGKSNPVMLQIQKECDTPNIELKEPYEDPYSITLTAEIDSEWPVTSLTWCKDERVLQMSDIYKEYNGPSSGRLCINNTKEVGNFQLVAENVAGVSTSDVITLCYEDINDSTKNAGRPVITRGKECKLQPITSPYKGGPDCDQCGYTAVAKIFDCVHHLCWNCLMVLKDSSESMATDVHCIPNCTSWLTRNTVQSFLQDDDNSDKYTSLYFKLVCESGSCRTNDCSNQGYIKVVYCGHTYCVKCTREYQYDGNSICKQNAFDCNGNPPQKNFLHMQKSLAVNELNPFLFKYQGKKNCSLCHSKIDVFEISRCGHRFCAEHIEVAKLPVRETLPFDIGKCLQEGCEEYFKFPIIPLAKEEKDTYANKCGSTLRDIKTGKDNGEKNFAQGRAPMHLKEDKSSNNVTQNSASKRRQNSKKNDSSKKQKTTVSRFTHSTGLSNVGLSCYRNAILQTLAETPFFQQMLNDGIKKKSTSMGTSWIALLSTILGRIGAKNTGVHDMLDDLHHFHYAFNEKNSEYREYQQEDTLSFLTSILNGLHDEFKELDKPDGSSKRHLDPTFLFRGSLKDNYKCRDCREVESIDGEEFYSLPLPEKESTTRKGKFTLGACIKAFLNKEDIDVIPCSSCKSVHLTKQLMIAKYPVVLVLQICKIEETMYAADRKAFEKNINGVVFWENFRGLKAQTREENDLKEALKHYRLFSVVEHIGSASSGHYICYVRRQDTQKWNRCDDSYVTEAKFEEVLKSDAYLLFYEKCETELQ